MPGGMTALGERVTWIAGLVLSISAFTDWYAGSGSVGPTIGVIGWHTGTLGKLVFRRYIQIVLPELYLPTLKDLVDLGHHAVFAQLTRSHR